MYKIIICWETGVLTVVLCVFHSLASHLQLTFTGFFHKAGKFLSLSAAALHYFRASADSGSVVCAVTSGKPSQDSENE